MISIIITLLHVRAGCVVDKTHWPAPLPPTGAREQENGSSSLG